MQSGIYQIRNTVNGRVYVGSAVNIRARWQHHVSELNQGVHGNGHLQNAWRKYGADVFMFEILESVEPKNLIEQEQYWMDLLDVAKSGYNILPKAGSRLGVKASPETLVKMSAAAKRQFASPEARAKVSARTKKQFSSLEARARASASRKGQVSYMKGKKHTEETKRKISRAARNMSDETRARMSEGAKRRFREGLPPWNKGRKISDVTRKKISGTLRGKKASLETRMKMSETHRKRWQNIHDLELKPFFDAIFRKRGIA